MSIAYIRPINPPGELALVEIIELSPGTPPDRPKPPGDKPPGDGIWGPDDPRPQPPIELPPIKPPGSGEPDLTNAVKAVIIPVPASDPPVKPPDGMPAGSVQVLVYFGPGTKTAVGWVAPYVSAAPPVTPETP